MLLIGVHAADIGAVGLAPAGRARAHALDESDGFGLFAVRGPEQLALGGAAGIDQTFELQAGEHVFKAGVAVFIQNARIIGLKAGGHHDGAHTFVERLVGHVKVDAFLLAGLQALAAHRGLLPRHSLGLST